MGLRPLPDRRGEDVAQALANARAALAAFRPEIAVIFAPDHYNAFFYDLMPPFCIGTRASAVGDYGTRKGALNVDGRQAAALHEYLMGQEFDAAVSHDMRADHAVAQPLEQLLPADTPIVPIFINCVALPVASLRRVARFGEAVGRYFRQAGLNAAFIGSGGLSHDPPLPTMSDVDEASRERIVVRREATPEERSGRETRTMQLADAFAAGKAPLTPLSRQWDLQFLDRMSRGDWQALETMSDDDITRRAGRSAHEVRTWLAAFGALRSFGRYRIEQQFYAEVPEWIVGYGAMRGLSES
jgi:2,3-dihydroxyphenylpropionate 1,2-dioxygenase